MKRTLVFQVPGFIVIRIILGTMVRLVYPFLPIFGRGFGVDL